MLNPFDFAPHSLWSGTSQAKLREASRSLNRRVLLAMNEILRHFVPQNDIGQEPVISSKARNPMMHRIRNHSLDICNSL